MIKTNLNCQNPVETEAFPLYISIDLVVKPASAVFFLSYAPNSVKDDSPFGGGCQQAQTPCTPALVLGLWLRAWRGYQHLTLLLSAPSRVEASMSPEQEASSVLEDLKRLIAASDWALGGLVVIGIFCLVFIALILFAAIFGCCTSPRHKQGGS